MKKLVLRHNRKQHILTIATGIFVALPMICFPLGLREGMTPNLVVARAYKNTFGVQTIDSGEVVIEDWALVDSVDQLVSADYGDDSGAESSEEKESSAAQDSEPEVSSDVSSASGNKTVDISDVNVRPADWTVVEWENYSNQYFTLTIPKGWQVQWQGDANRLEWMATAPDLTVGMYNIDHA